MADPTIVQAVITGLVSTFAAYTTYKTAVGKAEQEQTPPPPQPDDAAKGAAVASVIETAIAQHGTADEQADLANFQRNPQRYAGAFASVLADIAARSPEVAQQLQVLTQQANIAQAGSLVVNIGNYASNQGAQGTFNAPVTFGTQPKTEDK